MRLLLIVAGAIGLAALLFREPLARMWRWRRIERHLSREQRDWRFGL